MFSESIYIIPRSPEFPQHRNDCLHCQETAYIQGIANINQLVVFNCG